MPVFDAHDATARCLASLARHTPAQVRLVLVNDASTDPRMAGLFERFSRERAGVTILERERNGGFVAAVNDAFVASNSDAIVLNSDTEVTEGWYEALLRCRDSDPAIGIVCPLSNNATILSIEGIGKLLERPDGTPDADAIAACVRRASRREYPRLPVAVGFCMLVRRAVIERCGNLDPVYRRGYAEECDLSMRALDAGFEIACCDDAYVQHAGEASFGSGAAVAGERAANRSRLVRRWPGYEPGVRAWLRKNPLRPAIERVQAEAERTRFPDRPRVLIVMHRFGSPGGIEEHVRLLVNALRDRVVFTIAWPTEMAGMWMDMGVERIAPHARLVRVSPAVGAAGIRVLRHPASVDDPATEAAFASLLPGLYDAVHFHSFVGWNSLRLPRIAREAGARVVISAHDLGLLCADYNMATGPEDRPCGRAAARASDAGCVACLRGKSDAAMGREAPPPISIFIEQRYAAVRDACAAADAIVAPSEYLAARLRAGLGDTVAPRLRVIGHGVHPFQPLVRPARGAALRVAFVGRFGERKGGKVLCEAAQRLAGQGISFEIHGPVDQAMRMQVRAAGLTQHGEFRAEALPGRLAGVDLVVVPTLLEESFCLAVSEAQRLGIPVAASRIGAIPERVHDGENGFLLEPGDAAALAALILRLRNEPALLDAMAERLRAAPPRTVEDAAHEYHAVYRDAASRSRPVESSARPDGAARTGGAARGDSAALVRLAFGLPRSRRHSPLGTDAWERWLEREPTPEDAPRPNAGEVHVLCIPGADAAMEEATLRALRSHAPGVAVTVVPRDEAEADVLAAVNAALGAMRERVVVVLQAGDVPAPGALAALASAVAGDAILVYGDDEAVSRGGERYDAAFKPPFDLELLRNRPYLVGACAFDRERVQALGGLRASGWLGVCDLAYRLAESGVAGAIRHAPGAVVRRDDRNVAAFEAQSEAAGALAATHLARIARAATWHAATSETPAHWRYVPRAGETVALFVVARGQAEAVDDYTLAMIRDAGAPIEVLYVDLPKPDARRVGEWFAAHGMAMRVEALSVHDALATALRTAPTTWLALVDARCAFARPGWLARLRESVGDAQATAFDLMGTAGRRIPGWEVLGGGPWAIAGAAPAPSVEGANADLYETPRTVSSITARMALVRRAEANAALKPGELLRAGRYEMTHLCLALQAHGARIAAHPHPAALLRGPDDAPEATPASASSSRVPADVRWMRERWDGAFGNDPHYHEALALTGPALEPEPHCRARVAARAAIPRIAAFPFDRWGSGEARVRQPCAALERAGLADVLMLDSHDTGRVPNRVEWSRMDADAILAHNFFHDHQLAFLEDCARRGRGPVVLGLDDLLTNIPPGNPFSRTIYRDIGARIARAAALSDRLVVSTPALAEAFGALLADVRVIPNALDAARWSGLANRPRGRGRPRVGWAGARQHRDDLLLLAPVMRSLAREVDWIFLGMCPEELRPFAREVHPMVPYARFPETLAALELNVAVAPLVDHPFNRAKSNIKLLEYGMLGLPVVCSDLEPYRGSPATRVGPAAEAWVEALRAIVRDPARAAAEGAAMREWVERTGTFSSTRNMWYKAITDATGRTAA